MAWPGSPFRRSSVTLTRKSSTSSLTPYRVPGPTPTKSRPTRYWSTVYADQCHKLSQKVGVNILQLVLTCTLYSTECLGDKTTGGCVRTL